MDHQNIKFVDLSIRQILVCDSDTLAMYTQYLVYVVLFRDYVSYL